MTVEPKTSRIDRLTLGRRARDRVLAPVVNDPAGMDFELRFRRYYPRVLAYVLRRLADRSAADDLTAETFLIAWRRRANIPAEPLPWLFSVAGNLLHNERRSAHRRAELALRVAAEPALDHAPVDADNRLIFDALARLSARDREVLMLVTWDGLDRARAAAVLGCSEKTFAVRLHRGPPAPHTRVGVAALALQGEP